MENKITTKEGNWLIAEFMGAEIDRHGFVKNYDKIQIPDWAFIVSDFDSVRVGGYNYHTSWDWLMPACKKFDMLDVSDLAEFEQKEYVAWCERLDNAAICYDINKVYEELIDCITWYNIRTT